MCRKEIFQEIKKHTKEENIANAIIARDYNQGISENAARQFYTKIGASDEHSKINNIPIMQLDKTCKNGSRTIDSITVSSRVMSHIEGSQLVDHSEIVESDHGEHAIDAAMEEYFKVEFS